jgi:hypothetical protein
MKWFSGLHHHYYHLPGRKRIKELISDFLASGADILLAQMDFFLPTVRDPRLSSKVVVLFIDNKGNESGRWEEIENFLSSLSEIWGDVIVLCPTDKRLIDLVSRVLSRRNVFPLWMCLPYTYRLYQRWVEPIYGDFLMAWVAHYGRGKWLIDAASVFVKVRTQSCGEPGPDKWCEEMHFESRGFLWAATHDSISRAFITAAVSQKPAVMLRTGAQLFDIYGNIGGGRFYESILLAEKPFEWLMLAHQVLSSLDLAREFGQRLHRFFYQYREFWEWEILWQRFIDQFGIKPPKDMSLFHYLPPNYFFAEHFDSLEAFPQGPWSNEPLSVNWGTGLGLRLG